MAGDGDEAHEQIATGGHRDGVPGGLLQDLTGELEGFHEFGHGGGRAMLDQFQ